NLLQVQWSWPADELIRYAWIFWDAERQPRPPGQLRIVKNADFATLPENALLVTRASRATSEQASITINTQKYIYTKVCIAMYDEWDSETKIATWYFSPAIELLAQICQGSIKRGW
ncbi:MAG TPA: hypothetical protein VN729_02785, partial [Ktedonobacteraceae bacterium]|nr:hypothetical protein [Ktedonobacteraceae bacterium]